MRISSTNLDYQIIFGVANSDLQPSASMPTRTHEEKSMAINAWAQEMALAAVMRAEILSGKSHENVRAALERSLVATYAAAGYENPAAVVETVRNRLRERLQDPSQYQSRSVP